MRLALALIAAGLVASAAHAAELRPNVRTDDAMLTLGEVLDGAGAAHLVVVAQIPRAGQTVTLDAGQVQALAAQNGVVWSNARSVRRIIATRTGGAAVPQALPAPAAPNLDDYTAPGFDMPDTVTTAAPAPAPQPQRPAAAPLIVKKGDSVRILYISEGMTLSVKGRALEDGRLGQTIRLTNVDSNRVLDARITGPSNALIEDLPMPALPPSP
jgi:flagella basal body P-ring formation protein FlgA